MACRISASGRNVLTQVPTNSVPMSAPAIPVQRSSHLARTIPVKINRTPLTSCTPSNSPCARLRSSAGIGVVQAALARRHPDLLPVLAATVSFELDIWLAVHQDQRDQPAIRAVFDGLTIGLGAHCGAAKHAAHSVG